MQIVATIHGKSSYPQSLREIIIKDLKDWDYQLAIEVEKRPGRSNGWAKVKAEGLPGVINISWDGPAKLLVARAIAKQGNAPNELLGRFLSYLLERRRKRIS